MVGVNYFLYTVIYFRMDFHKRLLDRFSPNFTKEEFEPLSSFCVIIF